MAKDYVEGDTGYGSSSTSLGGGTGNLTGSMYDYSSTYGGKYNTPAPGSSSATAIGNTLGNLQSIETLASHANTSAANQAVANQNILTPGYSGNMDKWSQDINNLLSGKVSSGTINTISQQAAERGISSGIAGSQNNESALLRALGLTSEGLQATGASQLSSMVNTSPKVAAFDITPYLTTGNDVQSAQLAANQVAAAADPASAASAAINAAKTGVTTGQAAAGTAPSTAGTGSSIASLLSSILGTGSGGGGLGGTIVGNSLATGTGASGSSGQSFQDWYNSTYGNGGETRSANDYTGQDPTGDMSLGVPDTSNLYADYSGTA